MADPARTAPAFAPPTHVLDDIELLRNGALGPALVGPQELVEVVVPAEVNLATVDSVVVTDSEGVPLATLPVTGEGASRVVAGRPHWQGHRSSRPFESLHVGPTDLPGVDLLVLVDDTGIDPARLDAAVAPEMTARVLVLAAAEGPDAAQALTVIRGVTEWAHTRPGVEVVVAPLGSRASHRQRKTELVVAAYGESAHRVIDLTTYAPRASRAPARGTVLFFTGLSGSGKSTVARAVRNHLLEAGKTVTFLDGDEVRRHLTAGLGFSPTDRDTNIRRIGWVAAEVARHGGLAICSPIAPFDATRRDVRAMVEGVGARFFLVHVATPLEECERRDRKGLYARARRGEIPDFTGISSPYEAPTDADLVIDTTGRAIEQLRDEVLAATGAPNPTVAGPTGAGEDHHDGQ